MLIKKIFILVISFFCISLINFTDADSMRQEALINMTFQKISVRSALELLAQYANKNIVISDAVKGDMSLNLHEISWSQALITILTAQKLKMQERRHVLYITPDDSATDNQGLHAKVIFLRYAKAHELINLLKADQVNLVDSHGFIGADERTNSILVEANRTQIKKTSQLINQLDVPVSQVMIAARIVNMDSHYENELGLRFGVNFSPISQNSAHSANMDPLKRLNVELPGIHQSLVHFGLAMVKLPAGILLDLELSALEAEGRAEIISRPELVAANQQPAIIQAGQEIPYQEKTSSGATNTTFKKAVLSLKVTPQIIPGGKILLHLQVNQDSRSSKEVLGVPTIDTREITTQILVGNKQTAVLGGIYEESDSNQVERVPFLASLPIVGNLFRYHKSAKEKRELLIFVTPIIIAENEGMRDN